MIGYNTQSDPSSDQSYEGLGSPRWQQQEGKTPGRHPFKTDVTPAKEAIFHSQTVGSMQRDDDLSNSQTGPVPVPVPIFGADTVAAEFEPFASGSATIRGIPALDFNGYILHAVQKPVPEELQRDSTGASIAEPDAILDEENGRTYHNYHDGRYYLPNDPV